MDIKIRGNNPANTATVVNTIAKEEPIKPLTYCCFLYIYKIEATKETAARINKITEEIDANISVFNAVKIKQST